MTRRMLDSVIWHNEKFAVMPPMARLLAIGIINHADDQGRNKANPIYLRSQILPYDDVTGEQIANWLTMIASNETIMLYQVVGKDYYQILNWWTYQAHQYAMPSQYPKPQGWQDRIRKSLTKGVIVTCNWTTVDGKRLPDTCNEQGLAIQVNNQVNNQVDVQGEDTRLSLSSSLSTSLSLSSNLSSSSTSTSKSNGVAEEVLIDTDTATALQKWNDVFFDTPWVFNPPMAQIGKWLHFSGVEVLCYMIEQAKDKRNPAAWLWTVYDDWDHRGSVSPAVEKAVRAQHAPKRPPVTAIIDPNTGKRIELAVAA